eukprot:g10885.t1
MQQKTASVVRVGWMALIFLLNGRAANSQGLVDDTATRILSRGLSTATTTSATSSTNTCPDEAQACLKDETCAACFNKPESTFCVSAYLEGDLTCDGVFSGFFCCEYGEEDPCVDNALLLGLFGCNAIEAGCTLADSCSGSESMNASATDATSGAAMDAAMDAEAVAETDDVDAETAAEAASDAGMSIGRSGAAVLCSTVVMGLLAAVLNALL